MNSLYISGPNQQSQVVHIVIDTDLTNDNGKVGRLFVIIPGFGDPHWNEKVQFLRNNILCITNEFKYVDFVICQYTFTNRLPDDILNLSFLPNNEGKGKVTLTVNYGSGIVGEFIKRYALPSCTFIDKYDYVMMLLDDIELQPNIRWSSVLKWKKDLNINIMSPSLTLDSKHVYTYMLANHDIKSNNHIIISPICEMFCYLTDIDSFVKWYTYLDDRENPWLWGMDLLLARQFNLRVGLLQTYSMRHHYQTQNSDYAGVLSSVGKVHNAAEDFHKYLAKFGEKHETLIKEIKAQHYLIYALIS